MPNHCCNTLILDADPLSLIVKKYVKKDERNEYILDFELIEPVGNVNDSYEQRLYRWGTPWVGYDLSIGETTIDFFTAWTPPTPIVKKLAELHKDYVFKLEYYEAGCTFRGFAIARWDDGEVLLQDNCWEMTEDDFKELGFE